MQSIFPPDDWKDYLKRSLDTPDPERCTVSLPQSLLTGFRNRKDKEIVGWLAAMMIHEPLAPSIHAIAGLIRLLGNRPYLVVKNIRLSSESGLFGSWRYRGITGGDIALTLAVLQEIYRGWSSMERFVAAFDTDDRSLLAPWTGALRDARRRARRLLQCHPQILPDCHRPLALIPDPDTGSCLHRIWLFSRWMVRRGHPDLGLWPSFSPDRLLLPLDARTHRAARRLGLIGTRRPSRAAACEITARLRQMDPRDPVKYHLALRAFF